MQWADRGYRSSQSRDERLQQPRREEGLGAVRELKAGWFGAPVSRGERTKDGIGDAASRQVTGPCEPVRRSEVGQDSKSPGMPPGGPCSAGCFGHRLEIASPGRGGCLGAQHQPMGDSFKVPGSSKEIKARGPESLCVPVLCDGGRRVMLKR